MFRYVTQWVKHTATEFFDDVTSAPDKTVERCAEGVTEISDALDVNSWMEVVPDDMGDIGAGFVAMVGCAGGLHDVPFEAEHS